MHYSQYSVHLNTLQPLYWSKLKLIKYPNTFAAKLWTVKHKIDFEPVMDNGGIRSDGRYGIKAQTDIVLLLSINMHISTVNIQQSHLSE